MSDIYERLAIAMIAQKEASFRVMEAKDKSLVSDLAQALRDKASCDRELAEATAKVAFFERERMAS